MIVSGGQQRGSAIGMHVSIPPQTLLPSSLPHNIEQHSWAHSRSLLVIHFKYNSVYMSIPNTLTIPSPQLSPVTMSSFSKAVSLLLFCK